MDSVEITIRVPIDYTRDAEEFDMLNPQTIQAVLREELDRRIMEFVNEEIKAYRAEKRAKSESA